MTKTIMSRKGLVKNLNDNQKKLLRMVLGVNVKHREFKISNITFQNSVSESEPYDCIGFTATNERGEGCVIVAFINQNGNFCVRKYDGDTIVCEQTSSYVLSVFVCVKRCINF